MLPVALIAISSLVLLVVARGRIGAIVGAIGVTLEVAGATILLFVANLALGAVLVLVARRLAVYYTTLYEVADVTLLVCSLLQAVTITIWRRRR